jgi:hypothetical protein
MTFPHDFWVLRDSPISLEEWMAVVAARGDIQLAAPFVGRTPGGQVIEFGGPSLFQWQRQSDGEALIVSYSEDGVHITEGDNEARMLADDLAARLGGWVRED